MSVNNDLSMVLAAVKRYESEHFDKKKKKVIPLKAQKGKFSEQYNTFVILDRYRVVKIRRPHPNRIYAIKYQYITAILSIRTGECQFGRITDRTSDSVLDEAIEELYIIDKQRRDAV